MSETHLNRRQFCAITAGTAVGVAGVHLGSSFNYESEAEEERERRELMEGIENPRERVGREKAAFDRNPLPPRSKDGDPNFRELASRPVVGVENRTRAEYVEHFFGSTRTVVPGIRGKHRSGGFTQKWLDTFQEIPVGVRQNLSQLVAGQVAQESKFKNFLDPTPGSDALTMWQIIPDVYKNEAQETAESMAWLTTSTRVAFYNYERIYTVLTNGVTYTDGGREITVEGLDFEAFKTHFNLTDDQWDRFLSLCMMNAYNTGERRILQILDWFMKTYRVEDLSYTKDKTELGLFAMMSDLARKSSKFGRYGEESNDYVFKCLGGAESLSGKSPLNFSSIDTNTLLVDQVVDWASDRVLDAVAPVSAGVVTAAAVHAGLGRRKEVLKEEEVKGAVEDPSEKINKSSATKQWAADVSQRIWQSMKFRKKTKKVSAIAEEPESNEPESPMRRKFLGWGAVGGGLAAVAGTGVYFRKEIADTLESGSLEGTYSLEEVDAEVARLRERGIRLYSSTQKFFEDGRVDAPGRTAFVGMRKDVWATMEELMEELDLLDKGEKKVVITGMAEGAGHSGRKHGHGTGYSIDLRVNQGGRALYETLAPDKTKLLPAEGGGASTAREVLEGHPLFESGLLVGNQIFRFNSKYFLFGVKHRGKTFICYIDDESKTRLPHYHLEMIPWEDYNQETLSDFVRLARVPTANPDMRGIWRSEVRDYMRDNI